MNSDIVHFRVAIQARNSAKDSASLKARSEDWLDLVFDVAGHRDPIDSLMCRYELSEPEAKAIFDDFIAEMHGEDKSDA